MIIAMTIMYVGCVFVAFRVIKFRVRPASIAVAAVIGIIMLGGIVIAWKLAAPMTGRMTVTRRVTPLLSNQNSKELIKNIYVKHDEPVKKGTVLYESETAPNEYAVAQLAAQLAASKQTVEEQEAAVEVADASAEKAVADQAYSKARLETALEVRELNPKAVSELQLEVVKRQNESLEAAVRQAEATRNTAKFALATAKNNVNATEEQLNLAKLKLEQCKVVAPSDGQIVNWQAVEGTMTTTVITSAQGTFMDMSRTFVAAVFPQNLLANVKAGDTVEIAFKGRAGQIATGKVEFVMEYTGEGQLTPETQLPVAAKLGSKGFLAVRIILDDEALAQDLPLGGGGTVAIYTSFGKPFHLISKVALRIKSWLNYLPV
jgi:multidrug resistance efflux pump